MPFHIYLVTKSNPNHIFYVAYTAKSAVCENKKLPRKTSNLSFSKTTEQRIITDYSKTYRRFIISFKEENSRCYQIFAYNTANKNFAGELLRTSSTLLLSAPCPISKSQFPYSILQSNGSHYFAHETDKNNKKLNSYLSSVLYKLDQTTKIDKNTELNIHLNPATNEYLIRKTKAKIISGQPTATTPIHKETPIAYGYINQMNTLELAFAPTKPSKNSCSLWCCGKSAVSIRQRKNPKELNNYANLDARSKSQHSR